MDSSGDEYNAIKADAWQFAADTQKNCMDLAQSGKDDTWNRTGGGDLQPIIRDYEKLKFTLDVSIAVASLVPIARAAQLSSEGVAAVTSYLLRDASFETGATAANIVAMGIVEFFHSYEEDLANWQKKHKGMDVDFALNQLDTMEADYQKAVGKCQASYRDMAVSINNSLKHGYYVR